MCSVERGCLMGDVVKGVGWWSRLNASGSIVAA